MTTTAIQLLEIETIYIDEEEDDDFDNEIENDETMYEEEDDDFDNEIENDETMYEEIEEEIDYTWLDDNQF